MSIETATALSFDDDVTRQELTVAISLRDLVERNFIRRKPPVDTEGADLRTRPDDASIAYGGSDADFRVLDRFAGLGSADTKPIRKTRIQTLQEWEGYVTDVLQTTFVARLVDVTAGQHTASEEAEFPLDDVADGDRPLVKPGAVFRWTVGYIKSPGGSKKRMSQLVFRRLPQWTQRDLDDASIRARAIAKSIAWE
jgi:hypothetical protein